MLLRNFVLLLISAAIIGSGAFIAKWFPQYHYPSLLTAFGLCLLLLTLFGKDTFTNENHTG